MPDVSAEAIRTIIPYPKLSSQEKPGDPLLDALPFDRRGHLELSNKRIGELRDGIQAGLLQSAMGKGVTMAALPLSEAFSVIEELIALRHVAYVARAVALADIDGTDANESHELFIHMIHVALSPDFDDDAATCPICRAAAIMDGVRAIEAHDA